MPFSRKKQFISKFAQELEASPRKEKSAAFAVIQQLLPQIEGMLTKGYSLTNIHDRFVRKGFTFSFETFRRHVRQAQKLRDWKAEDEAAQHQRSTNNHKLKPQKKTNKAKSV